MKLTLKKEVHNVPNKLKPKVKYFVGGLKVTEKVFYSYTIQPDSISKPIKATRTEPDGTRVYVTECNVEVD